MDRFACLATSTRSTHARCAESLYATTACSWRYARQESQNRPPAVRSARRWQKRTLNGEPSAHTTLHLLLLLLLLLFLQLLFLQRRPQYCRRLRSEGLLLHHLLRSNGRAVSSSSSNSSSRLYKTRKSYDEHILTRTIVIRRKIWR